MPRRCRALRAGLAGLCALGLAGCAAARFENAPLAAGQANPEQRRIDPGSPDRPVILMTFSGGGSRAAALAATVLGELAATRDGTDPAAPPLSDDVKLISAVSGGSVTAAWFGLNHGPEHPDGDLATFHRDFLLPDNMATLELDAVDPITWFRLAFTGFSRIDALEALLDRQLFHRASFAALNRPGRPFIVLNATDMAGGETFAFTPRRFDDICSAYDATPIATGVAASAAFPVLLTPVAFRNYSADCAGRLRDAQWIRSALDHPATIHDDLPAYREARYANDLRRGKPAFRDIRSLYFLDGGVADNLGVGSLRAALIEPYDDAGTLTAINDGKIRKLVIIVVNARSDPPSTLYTSDREPGLVDMLGSVLSTPIDANTASSQIALSGLIGELASDAAMASASARFRGMKIYGVTVDFDQIPGDTPEHAALRDRAKAVPTLWTLTSDQLVDTEAAGRYLLAHDPCYRLLLADLGVPSPVAPGDADAAARCATRKEIAPARP